MMTTSTRRRFLFLAAGCLVAGCTTIDVGRVPLLERQAEWVMLPFVNHTETPQAGLRAEAIAEGLLRAGAGLNLKHYPPEINTETLFEAADRKQAVAALEWARAQGARYAVTGSVEEWRYKVGIDGEPAAGLALQIIEVSSGKVVWSAVGGKTGWSRESLSAVAQKLMRQLLTPVISALR